MPSTPTASPARRRIAAALIGIAVLAPAAAAAEEAIDTDRPDFSDSPEVVGSGRFQVEVGYTAGRDRDGSRTERAASTPLLLRYGIGRSVELRLETEGLQRVRTDDGATRDRVRGTADASIGFKWHLADRDEDDGKPALALLGDAEIDSGSAAFRGRGVRPGLYGIAEWDFDGGWSPSVMIGARADRDDDGGGRYANGLVALALGKRLGPRWGAFGEFAAPQIASGRHGGSTAAFDAGIVYLPTDDLQLDVSFVRGLNHRTPDWQWGIGVSFRL